MREQERWEKKENKVRLKLQKSSSDPNFTDYQITYRGNSKPRLKLLRGLSHREEGASKMSEVKQDNWGWRREE